MDGVATQLLANFLVEKRFDVAVCELSDEQSAALSHNQFLERHDFRSTTPPGTRSYAAVVGYPDTKAEVVPGTTLVETPIFSMANLVQREELGRIFIAFDKKRVTNVETRRQFTAPDPYGMSGGAIFTIPVDLMAMANSPARLAGIATHWRRGRRVFEGATIERCRRGVGRN